MGKKRRAGPPPLSGQLRQAILNCGESRYAISKATNVSEQALSKFICGRQKGLSWDAVDTLGEYLGLKLVADQIKRKGQ